MNRLPNIKARTLKEAREELALFGITDNVRTLHQAKQLLLAKRAEFREAGKSGKPPQIPATPKERQLPPKTVPPIRHGKTSNIVNAQIKEGKSPIESAAQFKQFGAAELSAVYNRQLALIRGDKVKESDGCGEGQKVLDVLSRSFAELSKTGVREGLLLSRAHIILQGSELTKNLNPFAMLKDIKNAQATKRAKDKEHAKIINR